MSDLPDGWARVPLPYVVEVLDSRRIPLNADERNQRIAGKAANSLVPYYGATGQVGWIDVSLFDENLVLLGEDGAPFLDPQKPKAYRIAGKSWVNNHAHVLRVREDALDWRLLEHQLNSIDYTEFVTGTTRLKLTQGAMNKLPVLVPPLHEQTRIADQLDKLLARIQACNDRLDAIPALLKRFRQAVLAAAIAGDLTEEDRSANEWPFPWPAIPLGMLGELGRGKSKHRPRNDPRLYEGKYPFVQTGDVAQSAGKITQHRQTYSEFGFQQSRLWPAGTVCITIAANIADTAILTYPACFPDSVVGFISDPSKCVPQFVKWAIDVIKDDLEAFAPATAQKNINLAVLNDISIRCPSLDEQHEIVRRVEALFQLADRIEARYTAARTHAQRLTPLLLAKAFRGELVPQDPNDEPAGVLLERIAAERAQAAAQPRPRPSTAGRKPVRAPQEYAAMTKSRQDDDVLGQPYLARHLRRIGVPTSAEELFKTAELPVADFYKQLAWEVAQGHVRDGQTVLEPGDAA